MTVIDADITEEDAGLEPWDFFVQFEGVRWPVKPPSALQMSRIIDGGKANHEQACLFLCDLFAELTGIDRAKVAALDSEVLCRWVEVLADLVNARLTRKRAYRQEQRRVDPPIVTATPMRLN
jgi:hypothetical protein